MYCDLVEVFRAVGWCWRLTLSRKSFLQQGGGGKFGRRRVVKHRQVCVCCCECLFCLGFIHSYALGQKNKDRSALAPGNSFIFSGISSLIVFNIPKFYYDSFWPSNNRRSRCRPV